MTLAFLQPWLVRAQRERFALGAFNANTLEQLQAIVQAAQEESAPVIVQISHRALQHLGNGQTILGLRYAAEMGKVAAQSVSAPVVLHLDHATQEEVIQAIALGFTSVMFDGGDLGFAKNIEVTRELGRLAHAVGVCIEAEVTAVPRSAGTSAVLEASELTRPEDAAEFAKQTGVDLLAIAIGSVHSVKQKIVELDLARLEAIRKVVDVPLVLHGSSGVKDEHITQAIARGICKVNIATQLNQAFSNAVRAELTQDQEQVDPRKYLGPARQFTKERVRERIRLLGATGRV